MPRQRKTDKARLKEGRGTGRLHHYKPWLKAHELSDTGRAHRPFGIKTRRIHQLLSDYCLLHNEIGQSCKRNSPLLQQ